MRLLNLFDGIGGFGLAAKWMVCDNPAIADLLARMKWTRYVRFAADTTERLPYVVKAVEMLSERGLKPYRVFVYVLIRDVQDALNRINALKELGVIPFAQPYRDFDNMTEPTQEQKDLAGGATCGPRSKPAHLKSIIDT